MRTGKRAERTGRDFRCRSATGHAILVNTVFRSARLVFDVVLLSLTILLKDNKEKDNWDIILESRLFK